jgi:hypothetical protein
MSGKTPIQRRSNIGDLVCQRKKTAVALETAGFDRDIVQKVPKILCVSARGPIRIAGLQQLFARESSRHIQQAIAQRPLGCRRDQGFRCETRDGVGGLEFAEALMGGNGDRCFQRECPGKNRQPT